MYNVDIYVNYFVIEKFDVYDYFSDIRLIFFSWHASVNHTLYQRVYIRKHLVAG